MAMVLAAAAGNVLLKLAATAPHHTKLALLLDWRLASGIVLFATALAAYVLLLRRWPLNVAQSLMALQFVAVIAMSYIVLREPLPPLRVLGVMAIVIGVICVAFSHKPER
jgi:undecaprenyl phosphate-alpha-L-ara4N flippase subunit ArnE